MSKMADATPYSTRPEAERAREARCFRDILQDAAPVDLVLETFGGVGDTTAILRELWPNAALRSTELDTDTAVIHNNRHGVRYGALNEDALKHDWADAVRPGWRYGVVLDYNLCTLIRLRDPKSFVRAILDALPISGAQWVTITDAAIGKLHLNKASYGVEDLSGYIVAFAEEFLKLYPQFRLHVVSNHSRALYMRFDRKTEC